MRYGSLFLLCATACGGSDPTETPPETGPGETNCFRFETGERCTLETCCHDQACWYEADDGTTWTCADASFCVPDDAVDALAYCDVQESTGDTAPAKVDCLWEGDWSIVTSWCKDFEIDDMAYYYRDTFVRFTTPEAGGCDVEVQWRHSGGCAAVERWTIETDELRTPSQMDTALLGIESCMPEGCLLGDQFRLVECAVGDRVDDGVMSISEEPTGELHIQGTWHRDVLPFCTSELEVVVAPM